TTADDARRYRDSAEVEMWKKRDPLIRLRKYLVDRNQWDDEKEQILQADAKEQVAAAVKRAEEIAAPSTTDMFDFLYAQLPDQLRIQRATLRTASLGQDPSQLEGGIEASRQQGIEETVSEPGLP
ncbi:MAG: thiamine pyrophosphate-dependent enzyme, partial [Planctomycetota bacterium]|nr:thiamine pyrophosphate-dependent enzyme [Planctomycetota bacterium]